jgi:GH35 family endo-1,4-beta-xylanase
MTRRTFLQSTAATAALASLPGLGQDAARQLGAEEAAPPAPVPRKDDPQIRVLLHEADLEPLEGERARTLTARDLANDPLPQPVSTAEGRARIALASEPIQIAVRLKVPDFGEVFCFADNNGKGYTKPGNIEFVVDAAITRLRRIRNGAELAKQSGVPNDPKLDDQLQSAAECLSLKTATGQIAAAYKSLAHSLPAGERLVLSAARHRISKLAKPRAEFLFGGLASGMDRGAIFEKPFTELFNFATISWYTWNRTAEPIESRIDYTREDKSLEWCLAHKIAPKGFGYVYLANGATPEWIRSWPFEKVLAEYKRVLAQTMRRYSGRMPFVEVINEAHDKANLFHFSHDQILELTREACSAPREGSPTVKRLINHCCLWAEYGRRANPNNVRRWSPFRYLKDCVSAGVEFERIGLQLYYPQYDLFEIDAMLNRFKFFDRPLHITEISCNSADGFDAASMRPKSLVPGWHGPWTQTIQADWLEAIYTLCYSKPEFEAVGYWDLADVGGHFWPHGGLLNKDFTPRESYGRLLNLKKSWGL